MKSSKWQVLLGIILIFLSAILYLIHFLIFKDAHHIFIYLLGDIAFVPIEVFLVTIVIHQLLSEREKKSMLTKLYMVIGAFYSEAGTELLTYFSDFDRNSKIISEHLSKVKEWSENDFIKTRKILKRYKSDLEINTKNFIELKDFLVKKRNFMLRLLENPNLLEHEAFTDLLWAVFHMTEELDRRKDFTDIPEADHKHLKLDIERSYNAIILEWISYMNHLRVNYPYLYSLAMRTNPFDEEASVIISS